MKELRVAVAGVGYLGQHHARIWSAMPGVRLAGVADTNLDRAREVAARHGVEAVGDIRRIGGGLDAVSIAVPTVAHHELSRHFLENGVAVLVEKPIASTLAQADSLLEAARRGGALLGVGHTERFNPAVAALRERAGTPRFIECHRLGVFAPRSLDIDVVLDLMIHDIDVTLDLVRRPLKSVEAVGVAALSAKVDIANARLTFEGGCVANLTASRISATRTRKIRVFGSDRYLSCDCADRTLEHYRLDTAGGGDRPSIIREAVPIEADEPLRRELAAFADAVRGLSAFPVSGEDGRAALHAAGLVAARIIEASGA